MIEKVTKKNQKADALASADAYLIPKLMFPNNASWMLSFARNAMVIAYNNTTSDYAKEITAANWYDVLDRPNVSYAISDPTIRPRRLPRAHADQAGRGPVQQERPLPEARGRPLEDHDLGFGRRDDDRRLEPLAGRHDPRDPERQPTRATSTSSRRARSTTSSPTGRTRSRTTLPTSPCRPRSTSRTRRRRPTTRRSR